MTSCWVHFLNHFHCHNIQSINVLLNRKSRTFWSLLSSSFIKQIFKNVNVVFWLKCFLNVSLNKMRIYASIVKHIYSHKNIPVLRPHCVWILVDQRPLVSVVYCLLNFHFDWRSKSRMKSICFPFSKFPCWFFRWSNDNLLFLSNERFSDIFARSFS